MVMSLERIPVSRRIRPIQFIDWLRDRRPTNCLLETKHVTELMLLWFCEVTELKAVQKLHNIVNNR